MHFWLKQDIRRGQHEIWELVIWIERLKNVLMIDERMDVLMMKIISSFSLNLLRHKKSCWYRDKRHVVNHTWLAFAKHLQNSSLGTKLSRQSLVFFPNNVMLYCCPEGNTSIASANERPLWAVKVLISRCFLVFTNLCPVSMCPVSPNLLSSHVNLKWAT